MDKRMFLDSIKSWAGMAIMALSLVSTGACTDDDEAKGDAFFRIDGFDEATEEFVYQMPTVGIDTLTMGDAKQFTVRSNTDWSVVPAADGNDWCRVWPKEGSCDGLLRISATEDISAKAREMVFDILVEGKATGKRLVVKQEGSKPFIRSSVASVSLPRKGGDSKLLVLSNVDFDYAVTDLEGKPGVDWLKVERTDQNSFAIETLGKNETGRELTAKITLTGKGEYSGLVVDVPVSQTYALISDDFSWVPAVATASILGWDTTGEGDARYGCKPEVTSIYDAHGWESRANSIYARPGFIKLGKTNYGGDAIAPAMVELGEGKSNVEVRFQAVGYTSAGGTFDTRVLYVGLIGDGKIVDASNEGAASADIVPSVDYIANNLNEGTMPCELKNVACFVLTENGSFLKARDATGLEVWKHPDTKCSIHIEGATRNTRVVFIGNKIAESLNPGKNRIFLDNYVVLEE